MKPIYALSLLPIIAIFTGVFFANRITPYVLGMPFFVFWYLSWMVLTACVVAIIYKFDPSNREGEEV